MCVTVFDCYFWAEAGFLSLSLMLHVKAYTCQIFVHFFRQSGVLKI